MYVSLSVYQDTVEVEMTLPNDSGFYSLRQGRTKTEGDTELIDSD